MVLSNLQQKLVRIRETDGWREQRFQRAEALLERYARARLVITSRLHGALPCLALGTPVIFVHRDLDSPRFSGLLDYLRAYSVEEFKHKVKEIDLENPEPNPKSIDKLRDNLTRTCKGFIDDK
jgi:polysaccharide pyruvyl transferase WcaK-like protein